MHDFKGKRTTVIFFLDKDIDDILRTKLRSPHVVYTRYYDVENHLFTAADLAEAAAAAASFDRARIAGAIGNYQQWLARAAAVWKDWIKLCVFARKRNLGGEYNYSVASRINNPLTGPTDPVALQLRLTQLQAATGLPPNKFKRSFGSVSKIVDDAFTSGSHDTVFKGKWYATFLTDEIKTVAAGRAYDENNLAKRLVTALALTVNFDDPWANHFKQALAGIVDLL